MKFLQNFNSVYNNEKVSYFKLKNRFGQQ